MANYTMELREYIEQFSQYEELPVRNRIEQGRQHLFDFEYPIFDESYRNVFETHFIRNFYMREIGFESEGLFKFQLETWLNINMPYYNKLFESELLKYDPLTNTSHNETFTREYESTKNDTKDKTGNVKSADKMHDEGTTNQSKTAHEDFDSTTNKTSDSTSQNDVTQHSTSKTDVDESVHNTGETHSDTDNSSHVTNNGSSFDRNLTSDTPDSRLAITTNDGSGVIEYASEIKENTNKNSQSSDTTGSSSTDGTSKDDSTRDSTTNVTSDDKIDNDTTTHSSEKDTFTSDKDNTETVTGSHKNDGTKDSTIDTTGKETGSSSIKNLEDYVNSKVGKIGSVSYAQLVNEYRGSLLRIEKQLFNEMNELFMLVY